MRWHDVRGEINEIVREFGSSDTYVARALDFINCFGRVRGEEVLAEYSRELMTGRVHEFEVEQSQHGVKE